MCFPSTFNQRFYNFKNTKWKLKLWGILFFSSIDVLWLWSIWVYVPVLSSSTVRVCRRSRWLRTSWPRDESRPPRNPQDRRAPIRTGSATSTTTVSTSTWSDCLCVSLSVLPGYIQLWFLLSWLLVFCVLSLELPLEARIVKYIVSLRWLR